MNFENASFKESYEEFFSAAFDGNQPFDYQKRLATDDDLSSLVNVPTGAGETTAIGCEVEFCYTAEHLTYSKVAVAQDKLHLL